MTVFWPLITTGVETAHQIADDRRFVADCKVNPVLPAGQNKTRLLPEAATISCGGLVLAGNEMLNIVHSQRSLLVRLSHIRCCLTRPIPLQGTLPEYSRALPRRRLKGSCTDS